MHTVVWSDHQVAWHLYLWWSRAGGRIIKLSALILHHAHQHRRGHDRPLSPWVHGLLKQVWFLSQRWGSILYLSGPLHFHSLYSILTVMYYVLWRCFHTEKGSAVINLYVPIKLVYGLCFSMKLHSLINHISAIVILHTGKVSKISIQTRLITTGENLLYASLSLSKHRRDSL